MQIQEDKKSSFKKSLAIFSSLATIAVTIYVMNSNPHSTTFLRELQKVDDIGLPSLTALFQEWKSIYGKGYETIEEEEQRLLTFIDNYNFIQEFNKNSKDVVLALNEYADLTVEEFGAMRLGGFSLDKHKDLSKEKIVILDDSNLPNSVDWRTEGAVTPVKNQQTCGGCWAFAAAASLEGYNKIKNGDLVSLSEQQLIDCVGTCSGCNGCSNLYNALIYTSQSGIETESTYPFTGKFQRCEYQSTKTVVKNDGYQNVAPKSVSQLKAALANQPVIVGIQANQRIFQLYKTGVLSSGCGNQVDHAVTAVGYTTVNGQEAFIVKNSWGTSWGEQGYVYISADSTANHGTGVCGILSAPTYPTSV